ncbi:hypothetical protein CHS0354_017232 [Potamilus streckersoni]|uniref:TIR domain-containing protein n=1 Tax=Potamilus streckersoni TaxID=2493646 RepID=A0AAE0SI79_9BIVA|nr:hypothetical protein CHS0354_017232 [Potamilus streckersoni]
MAVVSKGEHLSLISNAIQTSDRLAKEQILIIYISILVSVIPITEASSTCTVNGIYYLCNNITSKTDFPLVLPTNVQNVKLMGTNKLEQSFPDALFNHPTWANVSELSILAFTKADHIGSGFLNGLKELKYLSISSCTDLNLIHPDIFHSTPNIEALYLDGNSKLKIYIVAAALINKLSNLKYLSLIGIQASEEHVVLEQNFSKALQKKNLTYLDISGVNIIYVNHVIVQDLFANLKYFNFSYSKIVSPRGMNDHYNSLFKNIELLDLTGTQYSRLKFYPIKEEQRISVSDFPIAPEYFFAQGIFRPDYPIMWNARYIFETCDFKFPKMLDLSKNSITLFNITFLGACRVHELQTLNLASNNMEYISLNSLSNFPSMKILDLSKNLLNKMQDMDEFSYIFSQNKDLEIIVLHNNHLTVVPSKLFASNKKLRLIDLSENELTYFDIDLHNTADLKLINLRNNWLKSLPATFLEQFDLLFWKQDTACNQSTTTTNVLFKQFQDRHIIGNRYRYGYNENEDVQFEESHSCIQQHVMINILENQFVCDCDTLVFMERILFTDIGIGNRTELSCKYGNNEKLLTNDLYQMVKENCNLASMIGIGVASSLAIMLSIFTCAITIHLRRKSAHRNQDLENLKKEILQENRDFKFVVFLSYCSQDSQIVDENILPSLNMYLREKFNTERDLVCTGADSFVPGMLIIEEIHRCINESLVVVPVITPAFLQSHWSQKECVTAVNRHRQVVILMKQHTDTSRASFTIENLIGQYTRGIWSDNEGHFVIRPSWNTICEGIIRGASESFQHHRRQNVGTPTDEIPLVE